MDYPVTLTPDDNHTILVTFIDWPANTFGTDREDAFRHAVDALTTMIDAYIKDGRDIPRPSKGKEWVAVPALVEAKIRLYETMRAAKVGKAELGRRLDCHLPQIDRLLAMKHGSKLEQLEAAFGALGKRLVVSVEDVAPGSRVKKATARHGPPRRPSRPAAR